MTRLINLRRTHYDPLPPAQAARWLDAGLVRQAKQVIEVAGARWDAVFHPYRGGFRNEFRRSFLHEPGNLALAGVARWRQHRSPTQKFIPAMNPPTPAISRDAKAVMQRGILAAL